MTIRSASRLVYRDGRLLTPSEDSRRTKVRWIERRAKEKDDGQCRDWPWALNNKGYAVVRWDGKQQKVGHVVMELSGRPRPTGLQQLHSCDRPSCVARWHLRWGTAAENMADSLERGRRGAVR